MTPLRHELIVAASLHNVGGRSPIDLKIESQIPSKVRGPQNNKTSTRLSDGSFGGRARLCWTRASCGEDTSDALEVGSGGTWSISCSRGFMAYFASAAVPYGEVLTSRDE